MATAALTSKLLMTLGRREQNWRTVCLIPAIHHNVHNSKSLSFLSKSKPFSKAAAGTIETIKPEKRVVDPDVVVDPDDEILVHREQPVVEKRREYTEDELSQLRNKSRLRKQHHRMLNNIQPYDEPVFWTHQTIKYQRKLYAKYGEQSHVNPGIQWPLPHELETRLEYESIARPYTFHQVLEKIEAKKKAEQEEFHRREREIDENMKKLEKVRQEYKAKIYAKEKEMQIAQDRREQLMEEVRRHFGYKVDVRDEKFQEMLEKKEKEQRKAMKEARKKARQEKEMIKLTGTSSSSSSSEDKSSQTQASGEDTKSTTDTSSSSKKSATQKGKKKKKEADLEEDDD